MPRLRRNRTWKEIILRKRFNRVSNEETTETEVPKSSAKENWIKFKKQIIEVIRMGRLLSNAERLRRGKDKHELNLEEEKYKLQWLLLSPENSKREFWEYLLMFVGIIDLFVNIY